MMRKNFSLFAATLVIGLAACNSNSDTTANTDTTATTSTEETTSTANTNTSTNDYTAMADTFRMNSEAGNYLDPRTGKSIRINLDPETGRRINAETGEPVWRYIDKRTWWVYGGDDWDTLGQARMDNGSLMYRDNNDTWLTYEKRWPDDVKMEKDWKQKIGDTKIKISKDGDIKIKDEKGKVKYDADDNKIKVDSSD
jgi:hypothetical protein